uniref:SWIM-type domain-containing protein n=1 Tax=Tanacetum cinerariifolium TaxID=118510 RepID=A0A6L2JAI8_TANCI|nr:hypothetical protein [Tanacetum cinerariifolium]
MAEHKVHGDHITQQLRQYVLELKERNPDTTVKIDVERDYEPNSMTRQFRRIYVCLGALKSGFKAGQRDLLCLDGCFMSGPFLMQILTAVGVDPNYEIYPLAYAIADSENKQAWLWILDCLRDDMELFRNSNFTFVTDRQKEVDLEDFDSKINSDDDEAERRKALRKLVRTRRELHLTRNDKEMVRAECRGIVPCFSNSGPNEDELVDGLSGSKRRGEIEETIKPNPKISLSALKEQLQKKYEIGVSKQKVFRAKQMAEHKVHGDHITQYTQLRQYVLELKERNLDTTVKIDVERDYEPDSMTRQFRRIYVCLGALKSGFKAGQRDLLGMDGCFMSGPFPMQILTAVGVDPNYGIYPLAYAIVESKNKQAWLWFLDCLGDDMELFRNSNFTFVTDRQKGLYHHWQRHSPLLNIARPHCNVLLNNICEALNRQLNDGRDKPIITCLEFIKEYLMKWIVIVQQMSLTKLKSNKAPECLAICSKALRFAKIVQDKKYISKNKERDAERMPSRIKKKCKDKAWKNNNAYLCEDDHIRDSEDDESDSMFSLGASLGITLDGKPARSKNDTFSDFLLEDFDSEIDSNDDEAERRKALRKLGQKFKDLLWKCATATTVSYFNRNMKELKGANKELYDWLKLIPAQHLARSHFFARPHCDVLLNNICEVLNRQLKDGRDKPIITCLEFIREYLMKRIVIIQQCVVNVEERACSCRKWNLTGMSCKHVVGAIWNIAENGLEPGIPESWVHPSYWLATWEEMYRFKINPCNGPDLWPPSDSPITYTPPEYHKPAGRPSKKRKKSAAELYDGLVKNGKLSRFGQTVTCCKCGKKGPNSRTCKGQEGATSAPAVNQTQTTQTTINPSAPAVNPSQTTQTTINSPSQTSPTMRYTKQKASSTLFKGQQKRKKVCPRHHGKAPKTRKGKIVKPGKVTKEIDFERGDMINMVLKHAMDYGTGIFEARKIGLTEIPCEVLKQRLQAGMWERKHLYT